MKYLKLEMENRLQHNAPLFEVKYELQTPFDVFIPSLDISTDLGFIKLIDEILVSIYSMSDMIRRIAHRDALDEDGKPYVASYESMRYEKNLGHNINIFHSIRLRCFAH